MRKTTAGELEEEDEEEDEEDDLFGAAYEDVVYRDSTDDGIESSLYDTSSGEGDALDETHDQIVARLAFLNSLSRLRRIAAVSWMLNPAESDLSAQFQEMLRHWLRTRETAPQRTRKTRDGGLASPPDAAVARLSFVG